MKTYARIECLLVICVQLLSIESGANWSSWRGAKDCQLLRVENAREIWWPLWAVGHLTQISQKAAVRGDAVINYAG